MTHRTGFYQRHREAVDILGEILLSISFFAFIPALYIILLVLGGGR